MKTKEKDRRTLELYGATHAVKWYLKHYPELRAIFGITKRRVKNPPA